MGRMERSEKQTRETRKTQIKTIRNIVHETSTHKHQSKVRIKKIMQHTTAHAHITYSAVADVFL